MADTIFNPKLFSRIDSAFYRNRFLITYIAFGILSLVIELVIGKTLVQTGITVFYSRSFAIAIGIFFAFITNAKFNFKVPNHKKNQAFAYFVTISSASALVNILVQQKVRHLGLNYEYSRLSISACLFFFAYLLHRRYSFSSLKKVGIAIYADDEENVIAIREKVGHYTDFIHVDIVDETFNKNKRPQLNRLELIKACWPDKPIEAHIMSTLPSRYVNNIQADTILVHAEIEEDLRYILKSIRARGIKTGVCLKLETAFEKIEENSDLIDSVLLLAIERPGESGQRFNQDILGKLAALNDLPTRKDFSVCIDGGVSEKNIGELDAEKVVSASSVLHHPNPSRQLLRLQTSSIYEKV